MLNYVLTHHLAPRGVSEHDILNVLGQMIGDIILQP